jgi:STE24 endopeptidase
VVAVLAHEMGHWKYSHTLKMLFINEVYIFLFLFTFSYALYESSLYAAFGFNEPSAVIGMMLFSHVYSPLDHVFRFAMNGVSRRFEFQADAFACRLGLDLEPPLVCIHIKNLGSLCCDPWYSAYYHSHPTLVERLRGIRSHLHKSS